MMETTTVTIQLPTDLYNDLRARAEQEQIDLAEIIARLVAKEHYAYFQPSSPSHALQRILERATDLGVSDLSEQHDHYLYGTEKQ